MFLRAVQQQDKAVAGMSQESMTATHDSSKKRKRLEEDKGTPSKKAVRDLPSGSIKVTHLAKSDTLAPVLGQKCCNLHASVKC